MDQPAPRSSSRRLTAATALMVVVFVVVGIGTPLLGLKVFAASDIMLTRAPWSAAAPTGYVPQNIWVSDTIDGVIPPTHNFVERVRDGDFAMWAPENSGGAELGSVPDNALLSPLSLPYWILPTSLAPGFVKLLEMAVALGGMFLFLRRIGLERAPAVLGGLVFVGSGFMVAWTNWPHTRVAALIPLLFWTIERIVTRRRPIDVALLAAVVAAMLLGGFPAVTGTALFAAAIYLAVRLWVEHRRAPRRFAIGGTAAGVGVVLGAGLAAFQLFPFLLELDESVGLDRTQTSASHSPFSAVALTVAPDVFGAPNAQGGVSGWFGPTNPVEEMSYLGVTALLLALVGALAWRRATVPPLVRGYFVVAALLTAEVIFLGGPVLGALQQLPVFSTNPIGRTRALLGFFAGVLAAIGFDALLRGPARTAVSQLRSRLWRLGAAGAWGGTALVLAAALFYARRTAGDTGRLSTFYEALIVPVAVGVVTLAALLVHRLTRRPTVRLLVLGVLPALVAAQALTLALPYWARVPAEQFYPETSTHAFLEENLDGDRYVPFGTMLAGTEGYYGLRNVGGRGFVDTDYGALLGVGCSVCFLTHSYVAMPKDMDAFDADVLDRLAAKFAVKDPEDSVLGTPERIGGGGSVVEIAPDEQVRIELPSGGLRAVGYTLADLEPSTDPYATIEVVVEDADGTVLVATERRLRDGAPPRNVLAAVPERAVTGAALVQLTLRSNRPLRVSGEDGTPQVTVIRPVDDGLEVVDVGPATVYQRSTAMARIRWAASSVVEPNVAAAGALLASGEAPDVVLAAPGPEPSGEPASVDVIEDSGDVIDVDVDAAGDGYLVVADALNGRWSATVDGEDVPLRVADIGYVAVAVSEGRHVVRLRHDVSKGGPGYLVSGIGALALVGLVVVDRRRSRRPGADEP